MQSCVLEGPTKSPIATQQGCATGLGFISDEPDVDSLRSLTALDHVDRYPLAQANRALAALREGAVHGAAVLLP